jgi:CDP-glucose 4,6-dehydratase
MGMNSSFFENKVILVTGHTGFKGSWLCQALLLFGAKVVGYSLNPPTQPNLFGMLKLEEKMTSVIGDVRDYEKLKNVFDRFQPSIVFHLAAQPIVRESYKNPLYTYDVNVMGTVNVCECVRNHPSVRSFVNITTDKVYDNDDAPNHMFREDEKLDGFDPYSNSKSCSELVTHSYYRSFYRAMGTNVSTVRAGNVIGGGDFSLDRIIPDCVRSIESLTKLIIRNPNSIRPYQHVLESLRCYLLISEKQFALSRYCGSYNVGPNPEECVTTQKLIDLFNGFVRNGVQYEIKQDNGPHEAAFLQLDNSKIKGVLGLEPKLHIDDAIKLTAEWYNCYLSKGNIELMTQKQIKDYFGL